MMSGDQSATRGLFRSRPIIGLLFVIGLMLGVGCYIGISVCLNVLLKRGKEGEEGDTKLVSSAFKLFVNILDEFHEPEVPG